jgi:hypothetical protein
MAGQDFDGRRIMKPRHTVHIVFLLIALTCLPAFVSAADVKDWSVGDWSPQMLSAWGDANLAVDFGANGLWNFNGSWIQLSRWNPERMEAWGDHQLAVDFGANGLWNYDGRSWVRLSSR